MRVYTRIMEERCICTALRQAAAKSTAFYDEALEPSGIKVTMFRILRRIDMAKAISITELAKKVGLDRSTLGRNLRVLEKQSLVVLSAGKDARERMVLLTDAGRETLEAAVPLWRAAQRDYADMIGRDALAVLNVILDPTSEQSEPTGGTP